MQEGKTALGYAKKAGKNDVALLIEVRLKNHSWFHFFLAFK